MSGLHRVVFDTSTLVSAALRVGSASHSALALACEADVLVSSDADLLVLHPWRGVPIVTPGDFLIRQ